MAELNRPPCGNHNTVFNIPEGPREGLLSGTTDTENNFIGARAAFGHQMMGGTFSASNENVKPVKAEGQEDPPNRDNEYPSSLRSSSTCTSYSLEISVSTNDSSNRGPLPLQTPPDSRDNRNNQTMPHGPMMVPYAQNNPDVSTSTSYRSSVPIPNQISGPSRDSVSHQLNQCTDKLGNCQIVTSKSTNTQSSLEKMFSSTPAGNGKLEAQPVSPNCSTQDIKQEDVPKESRVAEEDEVFYAFVILHAPEDTAEAVRIKEMLESISSATGATFSEDFAQPGRSTFSCVEDAIHNSALVMLLLTPNFKTHLNDTSADAALMNSIEKPHKYNTVIPLLPRANRLSKEDLPLVLRTKNPLDENARSFHLMSKKLLAPDKIQSQKKIWEVERLIQMQRERKMRLQEENRLRRDLNRETAAVQNLEQERIRLHMPQPFFPPHGVPQYYPAFPMRVQPVGPVLSQWQVPESLPHGGASWHQPPSNIHIQNAKYIMIGNESTMTVGGAGNSSEDED